MFQIDLSPIYPPLIPLPSILFVSSLNCFSPSTLYSLFLPSTFSTFFLLALIFTNIMQKTTKKIDDQTLVFQGFDQQQEQHPLTNAATSMCFDSLVYYTFSEFDENEYIQALIQRDHQILNSGFTKMHEKSASRSHAVNYILYMRAVFEFQLHTAYLSLCYFDSFVSNISINDENKPWAIQLISIVSLTLAAKMEENMVPSISDFQVGKYKFESKVIQRMELLLLDALEWKMRVVTPFSYFPCFINKFCDGPPSQATSSTINKLILAFMREVNLMDHHQYAIAFASILAALDPSLSREAIELKINNSTFSAFLDIEEIFTCYNIMVQLEMNKTAMVLNLPDSPYESPIRVFHDNGAATTTSSLCIKRKSLTFEDVDEKNKDGDLCKKSRLLS